MSHAQIVDLARNAIYLALLVSAPMLVTALGIGLVVSILQSVTSIQEQTLAFLPKLVGVSAIFLVALPWMLQLLVSYTSQILRGMPAMAGA
jgi:flagellar biosynthetic protein FliQ